MRGDRPVPLGQARRHLAPLELERDARARSGCLAALPRRPGVRAGRPGGDRGREPAGMVRRGSRDPDRGRRHGAGLHDQHGRGPRLPAPAQRGGGRRSAPARARQAAAAGRRPVAPVRFAVRHGRAGRRGRGARADPGLAGGAGRGCRRRRPSITGRRCGPDDLACFIYTSGTGGRPKGVMLTHGNILANLRGASRAARDASGSATRSSCPSCRCPLPTSTRPGSSCRSRMGARSTTPRASRRCRPTCTEARPTILTCVPRLYEVMRQRIVHGVEREGGIEGAAVRRRVELGSRRYRNGGRLPPHLALVDLALDRLVRAQGAGPVRRPAQGAWSRAGRRSTPRSACSSMALGLPLLQGYGQTEASPVVSVNPPVRDRIDTVGPPLDGVELKIAEDGEILVRGDLVMQGYWKDPEATAHALEGGWLHTGDIGELDAGRVPADHRPQEGPDRQLRRRQRRAAAGRGRPAARARDRPGDGVRRPAAAPRRPDRAAPRFRASATPAGTTSARTWRRFPRARSSATRSARR